MVEHNAKLLVASSSGVARGGLEGLEPPNISKVKPPPIFWTCT